MKIVLDDKVCLKNHLTLQEALIAAAINMGDSDKAIANMVSRGILDVSKASLTPEWKKIINKIMKTDDDHLTELAKKMQACFPEGKQFGTAFYYRCNTREVTLKLKKFFEVYGEYSDEQIIKATKKFVTSFNGDYRFLPLIKYFISKAKKVMDEEGINHVSEVSELASTLENMSDDEDIVEVANSEEWLMDSRN